MLTLALETSSETISLALATAADRIHLIQTRTLPHAQAEQLFPALDALFRLAEQTPRNVQRIVVVTGPGSYTGLRNGLTVARTLAQLNNIPIMGVPTLTVLLARTQGCGLISPWLDIRRGEVYTGLVKKHWSRSQGLVLEVLAPPGIRSADAWIAELAARDEPITVVGEGNEAWRERLYEQSQWLEPLAANHLAAAGGTLALLAYHPEAAGTPLTWSDYREVMPLYPDRPVAKERSEAK